MSLTYIALGSNLDNPQQQVNRAIAAINALPDCRIINTSNWYQTAAVGPADQGQPQPDYINGVVALSTGLPPQSLLRALQAIEDYQGRVRRQRWGARTLDLDILLYDNLQLDTPELQIPHPRIAERNFVLYPLADLNPDLVMPNGTALTTLLENCTTAGIVRLSAGASD